MTALTGKRALRPHLTGTAGTRTFWTDTIGTRAGVAARDGDPVPLPATPWSFRPAAGPAGRPAVEIYAGRSLVGVMVTPSLAPRVLGGACSLAWAASLTPWPGASCPPGRGCLCGSAGPCGSAWEWRAPAGGRRRPA